MQGGGSSEPPEPPLKKIISSSLDILKTGAWVQATGPPKAPSRSTTGDFTSLLVRSGSTFSIKYGIKSFNRIDEQRRPISM